jgi:DNA-binding MarR family transcriptional regulator
MQPLSRTTNRLSPESRCAREVLESVPQVMWFIRRQMRGHRGGLSLAQFRTLMRIRRQPTVNLSAVADHLGVSLPSASRLVNGLVVRGFLSRRGSLKDRRQMALIVTSRGQAVVRAARRATQQSLEGQISVLSARERAALMKSMGILKQCFASEWEPPDLPAEDAGGGNGNGNRQRGARRAGVAV